MVRPNSRGIALAGAPEPVMRHALNQVVATVSAGLFLAFGAVAAHGQNLPDDFVFLRDIDPSIRQDIRYADVNNFVGRKLSGYDSAECVVKRPVGLALQKVQRELMAQNLSLKMLDCYRPARASRDMVAWARDGNETPAQKRYNPSFSKAGSVQARLHRRALGPLHRRGARSDAGRSACACVAGIRSEQGSMQAASRRKYSARPRAASIWARVTIAPMPGRIPDRARFHPRSGAGGSPGDWRWAGRAS